jgi:hypothetical protein
MSTPAPVRARQSYRHEAFLWRSRADFVAGIVPFVRDGIDGGEAVIAGLIPEHAGWLSSELGSQAHQVQFVDILELGRNPARLIPALQDFLSAWSGYGRPARAIGEAMWAGRPAEEMLECELHEALLNVAVDPDLPFWLVCAYDEEQLDAEIIAEAGRSHPALATATSYQGSPSYRGYAHAQELFNAPLPAISGSPAETTVTARMNLEALAEYSSLQAAAADLWSDRILRLTDAVRRLAVDGLSRGAERVRVQFWDQPQALICDVSDETLVDDLLFGRRHPLRAEPHSLWFANQTCDLVQARSSERGGTTVRLHMRK